MSSRLLHMIIEKIIKAQTLQCQTEACSKKQSAKAAAVEFMFETTDLRPRNFRNAGELQVSNDNVDMNDDDAGKEYPSFGDEQIETTTSSGIMGGERETQFPQHSTAIDADGTGDENVPEGNREIMNQSGALDWGKNCHGSQTQIKGKNAKNCRLSKLIDQIRNSEPTDDELGVHLMLVSLDEQGIPSLQQPYLYCRPTVSVKQLCQYVALKAAVLADAVELCLVEKPQENIVRGERTVDPNIDRLRVLEDGTLAELTTYRNVISGHLVMAYRKKLLNQDPVGLS
ncbi:hypothetical protein RJT34_04438 [Clitoria ternatea]|uniref:Uncharacterized protein n=1 Tax=Clitoria ternatea TaxID=43366 RepID=A0AAN9Q655_CLITE